MPSTTSPAVRAGRIALLAIVVVAVYLRTNLTNSGLDGFVLTRTDERHYLDPVAGFLNGHWDVQYFVNPTLSIYLLYVGVVIAGAALVVTGRFESFDAFVLEATRDDYIMTIVGRSLSIGLGLATVPLLYLLGKRVFSRSVGLIAAAALAVDRIHIERCSILGNESLVVFLLVLFALALTAYVERPSARRHAVAGLLLGLAASAKYNGGIHVLTLGVATAWVALRAAKGLGSSPWRELRRPQSYVGFAAAAGGFFLTSPYILVHPRIFWEDFRFQASLLRDGYGAYKVGWGFYVEKFAPLNAGLPFALLCATGLAAAVWFAVRRREPRAQIILAATVPLYVMLGSGIFSQMRFYLPSIPFVLLAGAWALDAGVRWVLGASLRVDQGRVANAAVAAVALLCLAPHAFAVDRWVTSEYRTDDPRADLVRYLSETLEQDGRYLYLTSGRRSEFFVGYTGGRRYLSPQQKRDRKLAGISLRARLLMGVAGSEPDMESFIEKLEGATETHLVLSLWTQRRLRKRSNVREEAARIMKIPRKGRSQMKGQRPDYWKEAVDYLMQLELVGSAIGRGGHDLVCVFRLPNAAD